MKFWKKTAAFLFTAAMICSLSLTVSAADGNTGNEWEAEEVSPIVTESSSPQSDPKPQQDSSVPESSGNHDQSRVNTGVDSPVIPLFITAAGAAAAALVFSLKRQKQDP